MREADLHRARLPGGDLSNANLDRTDLRNVDLRGATLYDATLGGADLRGALFSETDLRGVLSMPEQTAPAKCDPNVWSNPYSRPSHHRLRRPSARDRLEARSSAGGLTPQGCG
ncbi:pentapeptide repeat-containing protein [Streptomyces sp. NPDC048550]|uniref:pentapeptide repeat-containing protein n=1 Tax=Streptomyces sp. NPDC048550 TaxID=3155739 RepID=UPI00341398E1